MDTSYFQPSFEQMNTSTIQLWLYDAQWLLPCETGATRELLKAAISAAATELLFRWRNNL